MTWRLHLTNQAVQRLDILEGDPALLAAWSRRDRVAYYDLETGTPRGEVSLDFPAETDRSSEAWTAFAAELKAPNDAYLPVVRGPRFTVYITDDGRMRLYDDGDAALSLAEAGEDEIKLDMDGASGIAALALDRFLGLSAALDRDGKLHLFQQHIRVGAFDLDMKLEPDLRPALAISRGGGAIYVTEGRHIILTDSSGSVRKRIAAHYFVRQMTCSPDGRYLITGDMETGVIRVYDGAELIPTHQRFAIDLLAEATQIQLLADLPPPSVALSALTINNKGQLAFSLAGVICVADLSQMDELPRPQVLL